MLRVEHDFAPGPDASEPDALQRVDARRAVITSIANPAAYNPATNLVTLSRQANERHNDIFSNQTSLVASLTTGRIRHDLSVGLELMREETVGADARRRRHARAGRSEQPRRLQPGRRHGHRRPPARLPTAAPIRSAVYVFDAFDMGPRVRVNGGIRIERVRHARRIPSPRPASSRISTARDTLVSGKAGIVYRLNQSGNVYASYGSSVTPPGSANFQLNAAAGNQNNPNVDPQKSTNYEVGTKWDSRRGGCS